jgi:hypothetical protein
MKPGSLQGGFFQLKNMAIENVRACFGLFPHAQLALAKGHGSRQGMHVNEKRIESKSAKR